MLIKRPLWEELKGFDPLFFMFGEEVDLCLRARKLGYMPMFNPEAQIIHYGGASEKVKLNRWEKIFRAKASIIRLHWSRKTRGFGIGMLVIWAASRAAAMNVLAALASRKFTPHREKWSEIWQRRKEWKEGFCHT
jgi:hypothetical protein